MNVLDFLNGVLDQIIPFWNIWHQKFLGILPLVKLGSGLFSGIFFILVLRLVIKTQIISARINEVAEAITKSTVPRKRELKEWAAITQRLRRGSEAELKLAVIEADKLFDDTIKRIGFTGEMMSERLKKITPAQLSVIDNVWNAHKVRNNVVHTPDYKLSRLEAEAAIAVYEKALKEWGLID
jgi:hypothetical protein